MTIRYAAFCAAAFIAAVTLQGTSAHALSMTECSAKYKAAKADGSLNGMKWNDFRKANCGSDTTAAPAAAPAPATAAAAAAASRPGAKSLGAWRPRRPTLAMPSSRARSAPNIPRIPPARPAWKPASTSTGPTRPVTATAV